jgi:molybdenum cofactor synthesis domain-containing protein
LVVKKTVVEEAVRITKQGPGTRGQGPGVLEVKEIRKPRAGVVITGNEVYHGRIKDAFAPIIAKKIEEYGGEVVGTYYAPDDEQFIAERLRELLKAGADLLITTGGMSVDPDDVTRFAIRSLGATDITYGSAVLPGAMVLVAYLGIGDERLATSDSKLSSLMPRPSSLVPILGIPACGMYHKTTVFDLVLPRVLAGERIGRKELADLGHGGLCLHCTECRYPACPFGK